MNREKAIEVQNVYLTYRVHPTVTVGSLLKNVSGKCTKIKALDGVSFSVYKGEIVGIVGPNGSGKSTLLRTLAGLSSADKGSVNLYGNSVSLMALGNCFVGDISGRDNIVLTGLSLGFSEKEIYDKMDRIIEFSEIGNSVDFMVRTYSSGMVAKLAFSMNIFLQTDIILIDEVLSVGDQRFKKKSYEALQQIITNQDRTVVLVSHNIGEIERLCHRVIWMDKGHILEIGEPKRVIEDYSK